MLNYKDLGKDFNLERSVQRLAQEIRGTLEMSMSTKSPNDNFQNFKGGYGLYFTGNNSTSYRIFIDVNNNKEYDAGDQVIKIVNFEDGVKISTISSSPLSIVFLPPDPKTYINKESSGSATITLQLEDDTTKQKSLTIKATGMVEIN